MSITDTQTATEARAHDEEAAANRIFQVLDDGAACILAAIGHEVGLFDTLAVLPPATSEQVADAAGLDERYVREWLGGMVTAGFVDYRPEERRYAFNPSYATLLSGSGPDNLGNQMRFIPLLAEVATPIAEKFRTGGGLSYEEYPRFHSLMAAESAAVNDAALVDGILPLTGMQQQLTAGANVADFGCGSGHAINLLAREYPSSRFVGYDFSAEAIEAARVEAEDWGLTNTTFEVRDVARVEDTSEFDLVTAFDAIHDQAHPAVVLGNIHRSLRADGTFLMVDINAQSNLEDNLGLPWATFLYAISTLHCMSVSLGQGGEGLGTAWGVQTAERMLREAGFTDVVRHDLEDDPFNAYFVSRP